MKSLSKLVKSRPRVTEEFFSPKGAYRYSKCPICVANEVKCVSDGCIGNCQQLLAKSKQLKKLTHEVSSLFHL